MTKQRPKRTVELQPPIGGVVLAFAYQNQAPFTAPQAMNARPQSVSELRGRIGTRPGLQRAYPQHVGAGEMRLLSTCQWVSNNTLYSTLVASAAGILRYSQANGLLSPPVPCSGLPTTGVISSQQLVHAVDLSQKLYIADWDPATSLSKADRRMKVFDPAAGTLAILTSSIAGVEIPTGCPAIARYRGRLVVAGARSNPQLAYACRVNDPTDWDAAGADPADETGAWVIGAEDAFAIGQPITALIATSDQCMIFGCTSSLWILRNDPRKGGSMNNLSPDVGIVSHGAWCTTPEGAIVFLSHNGLYMTYGGCADNRPEPLSRDRLPLALLNIGQTNKIVNLAFDVFANGVHIFVTPINTPYSTGTVSITAGVATLTGGTWPSWAADGQLTVNGVIYAVATRDSNTQLTLSNTDAAAAAGSSYSLVQSSTAAEHYFFDWKNKGFWPVSHDWKNEPTAIHSWKNFAASGTYVTAYENAVAAAVFQPRPDPHPQTAAHNLVADESTVLIGCRDGFIRWYRTEQTTDDGTAIASSITYGPLGFGRGFYGCTIDAIHGTLASQSGDIRWQILAGSGPEEALNSPVRQTGGADNVWTDDRLSHWAYPRILGSDFYVKLSDVDGSIWTIERVGLLVSERGSMRD